MNIIIKTRPSWRPLVNKLGEFKTLHPTNKKARHLSVEEQYSPEELKKIQNAAHFTKKMVSEEELHKDSRETFI